MCDILKMRIKSRMLSRMLDISCKKVNIGERIKIKICLIQMFVLRQQKQKFTK